MTCIDAAGKVQRWGDCVLCINEKASIQARQRKHPSLPPARPIHVEHEYARAGAPAYLAAWDVHRDHQYGVVTANKPLPLNKKFRFQRCRIPHASSDKKMQLIILTGDP